MKAIFASLIFFAALGANASVQCDLQLNDKSVLLNQIELGSRLIFFNNGVPNIRILVSQEQYVSVSIKNEDNSKDVLDLSLSEPNKMTSLDFYSQDGVKINLMCIRMVQPSPYL